MNPKYQITKFALTLLVLASFVFSLTGCPKAEKSIRTAKESSAKMAIYGEKLIQANIDAFRAGEISRETFADMNGVTRKFVDGLGHYRRAVAAAELAMKSGGSAENKAALDKLYDVFDEQVVAAFFDILEKLNVLSGNHADTVRTIITAIRLTIRAVQGAFADARELFDASEVRYAAA